jgi:DNA-binding CsgD family transcriptional regulator
VLRIAECYGELAPYFEAGISFCRERGEHALLAFIHAERARQLLAEGLVSEAQGEAELALAIAGEEHIARSLIGSVLIETATERGDLAAAEQHALQSPLRVMSLYAPELLLSRGRLRLVQNRPRQALDDLLLCGERLRAQDSEGLPTPPWRSSAALALLLLGERERATRLALEQVRLARALGAEGGLGHSLRLAAGVSADEERLKLLHECVEVLERSRARLELAHALHDLGAALVREGRRRESRGPLRRAHELALECGATRLAERAREEMDAGGGRRAPLRLSGVYALTPAERRVAELASQGLTNREIAQSLFVIEKTVELHLSAVYRKLGIRSRHQLRAVLMPEQAPAGGSTHA